MNKEIESMADGEINGKSVSVQVEKSANDDRIYSYLTLPNELSVLLVSDPAAERSAASLDVRVGHLCDPDNVPGLAHFCEHMLFLGTEKYPDENSYNKYLSEHGGSSNAYTDMESTNYYFDVDSDYLEGALDIFAQFFISPLFTSSATERELKAVDSEHQKNKQNDFWRAFQLGKSLVKVIHDEHGSSAPIHPFAKFGTGDGKTLSEYPKSLGVDVRSQLLEFHSRYYSANMMKVVVLGRESPAELEALVRNKFSSIPRKDGVVPAKFPGHPYGLPGTLSKLVRVVPVRDVRNLELNFPMRETMSLYRSKPARYLGHLLGHEGKGSILAYLKEKGWANGLSAGESRSCSDWSAFSIQVELTDEGFDNVIEVAEVIFAYLQMMKDAGPLKWVYDETATVAECTFRFMSKRRPIDYVNHLAGSMQLYPPEHIISGPYRFFSEFLPDTITELGSFMNPMNMIMSITSRKFGEEGTEIKQLLQKEEWYGTEHTIETIDECVLKRLQNATVASLGLERDITFPEINDMIASDFEIRLVPGSSEEEPALLMSDSNDKSDKIGLETSMPSSCLRLWYKPDNVFKLPKANVMVNLTSPAISESPMGFVCADLYASMLTERTNEFAYLASVAGLHCSFTAHNMGVIISLSGYNHKMNVLMQRIMSTVSEVFSTNGSDEKMKSREDLFDRLKDKQTKQYTNFLYLQPYQHAFVAADMVLEDNTWSIQDKIQSLSKITLKDLLDFVHRFHSQHRLEMLVHGNCSPKEALQITKIIADQMRPQVKFGSSIDSSTESRGVVVKPGQDCLYCFPEYNPEESNGCLCTVLQIGPIDLETNALLAVLNHLIKEPSFNELRTNEQLGYIVHTSIHTCADNVKGLLILIQSDGYSPAYLDKRVEEFLVRFRKKLEVMDEAEFKSNIDAVSKTLLEKNKNLGEESTKYWSVITNRSYLFKRLQIIGTKVTLITLEQILEFFDKYIAKGGDGRRKMSVQVYPKQHEEEMKVEFENAHSSVSLLRTEDDVVEFKRLMNLWPLPKRVNVEEKKASYPIS